MWWKNTNSGKKKAIKREIQRFSSVPSCVSTVEVLNLSEVLIFSLLTHLQLYWVQDEICFLLSTALLDSCFWEQEPFTRAGLVEESE